jgi:hypothetical protein
MVEKPVGIYGRRKGALLGSSGGVKMVVRGRRGVS